MKMITRTAIYKDGNANYTTVIRRFGVCGIGIMMQITHISYMRGEFLA